MTISKYVAALCLAICIAHADEGKTLLIDSPNQIEMYMQKPEAEQYPLLLILHGAGSVKGALGITKECFDHWLQKGYAVAAISMPGYGRSAGPKDFCGPATMQAMHAALNTIKNDMGVSDFGILGFGQGSTVGILLAAERSDVRFAISSNGGYNLVSHLQSDDDKLCQTLIDKGYNLTLDEASMKIRSPIEHIDRIQCPLFLLHREGNPVISVQEVEDFAETMRLAGKECQVSILPKTPESDEQKLSYEEVFRETDQWIEGIMK